MRTTFSLAALLFIGCADGGDTFVNEAEHTPTPAARSDRLTCIGEHPDEVRAIQQVRQVAESSVHELVTCGGAQLRLTSSLVGRVLVSNEAFFDPDFIATVEDYLGLSDMPFEHHADGRWRMPINGDSDFALRFMRPGSDVTETADVFDIGSYLIGVEVDAEADFDEMLDHLETPYTFHFTWTEYGPLGDLIFPAGRPEQQTFSIEVSLWDIARLIMGDLDDLSAFGPLQNLGNLEIESEVSLTDDWGDARVEYEFAGVRQSVRRFHLDAAVGFELRSLIAEGEGVTLQGDVADLQVSGPGRLSGTLVYAVDGVSVDGIRVVDDFGDGRGYPRESYWCPEDWKSAPYAE